MEEKVRQIADELGYRPESSGTLLHRDENKNNIKNRGDIAGSGYFLPFIKGGTERVFEAATLESRKLAEAKVATAERYSRNPSAEKDAEGDG